MCEDRTVADRRRLLEAQAGGHVGEGRALPLTGELRVGVEAGGAEDPVADRELGHCCADGLDLPGQLAAEDPLLRAAQPGEVAGEERLALAPAAVRPVDRGGADPDEDLVVLRHGPLDLFDSQDVRAAVPVVDNCSHGLIPSLRFAVGGSARRASTPALPDRAPRACRRRGRAGLRRPVGITQPSSATTLRRKFAASSCTSQTAS